MIEECIDLSFFYTNFGRDFIENFRNDSTKFFCFKNNELIVGYFLIFTDSHFPDQLFFGCFSLSDHFFNLVEFKDTLVSAAAGYGKNHIVGPVNFSIWFGNRVKTNGFENQYWWEPESCKYLKDRLLKIGFSSEKKYLTHFFDNISHFRNYFQASYDKALTQGFRLLDFDQELKKDSLQILKTCYELNCQAFSESHYYRDITLKEYDKFIFSKLSRLDNCLSCFIATPEGEIVGYSFCLIDKNEAGPFIIFKSILIHPQYQSTGLSSALTYESLNRAIKKNITRGAAALIREGAKSEYLFAKVAQDLTNSHQYELFFLKV